LFSSKRNPCFNKKVSKGISCFIKKKAVFQQKRLVPGCSVDDGGVDGVLKRRFQIVCQVVHMRRTVPTGDRGKKPIKHHQQWDPERNAGDKGPAGKPTSSFVDNFGLFQFRPKK